jgi:hypothetical protein
MRPPRRLLSGFSRFFRRRTAWRRLPMVGLLGACASTGCTLITDVDREKIPVPAQPPFSEVDAGPEPPLVVPDASVLDASLPGDEATTGDAGPSDAGDAGPSIMDAG